MLFYDLDLVACVTVAARLLSSALAVLFYDLDLVAHLICGFLIILDYVVQLQEHRD